MPKQLPEPKVIQVLTASVIEWPDGRQTLFATDANNQEWFLTQERPTAQDHAAMHKVLWLKSLKKKAKKNA